MKTTTKLDPKRTVADLKELRPAHWKRKRQRVAFTERWMWARVAAEMEVSPPVLSREGVHALVRQDWPGNVSRKSVLRAMALAAGGVIRPEHLALTRLEEGKFREG